MPDIHKKCTINRDVIVNCQNRTSLYEVTNFRVNKNCDRHYPHVIMKPYFLEARGRSRQSAPLDWEIAAWTAVTNTLLLFPICPLVWAHTKTLKSVSCALYFPPLYLKEKNHQLPPLLNTLRPSWNKNQFLSDVPNVSSVFLVFFLYFDSLNIAFLSVVGIDKLTHLIQH